MKKTTKKYFKITGNKLIDIAIEQIASPMLEAIGERIASKIKGRNTAPSSEEATNEDNP